MTRHPTILPRSARTTPSRLLPRTAPWPAARNDGSGDTAEIAGLALDPTHQMVYFTSGYYGGQVMRAPMGGGTATPVASTVGLASSVAVNGAGNQIIWVEYGDATGQDRVMGADLDGGNVTVLIDGETQGLAQPRNVVLDLVAGHMYVSDIGGSKVVRADLDGGGLITVLSGIQDAYGLALNGSPCIE